MKRFMAIYTGSATPEQRAAFQADTATMQAGAAAWGKWMRDHASAIVDTGGPLGKTRQVDSYGLADSSNEMSAYTIVQAESHEEAARMFEGHPHFAIFPGKAVEIMECLLGSNGCVVSTFEPAGEVKTGTFETTEPSEAELARRAKISEGTW